MENHMQSSGETQKPPKKPFYKRWWFIVICVIFVLAVIGSVSDTSTPNTASTAPEEQEKASQAEPATPEVTVTSTELIQAYGENEVSADAKYKGKILEVSGLVNGIDNGITDKDMIVRLAGSDQYSFMSTTCYMLESEKEKVLALKKDQKVTLIGKGDSATLGSPMLRECHLK